MPRLPQPPRNSTHAIELAGVTKEYRLREDAEGVRGRWLFQRLSRRATTIRALDTLTLDIRRGETFGVLGPNGAGKSTLLRLMAGVSFADAGEVRRLERVAALLDLSVGFHPLLSGYENLFLGASLVGMGRGELRRRLGEIISFSGLDHVYLEQPVRFYSAGMIARLGLALALFQEPDILLIDEVMAVGDAEFQTRVGERLLQERAAGKTLVLVTHDVSIIEYLCDRALWLEQGQVRELGAAADVIRSYHQHLNARRDDARRPLAPEAVTPDRPAPGFGIRCLGAGGEVVHTAESGDRIAVEVTLPDWTAPGRSVVVSLLESNHTLLDEYVFDGSGLGVAGLGGHRVTITFDPLRLVHGRYILRLDALEGGLTRVRRETEFEVTAPFHAFSNTVLNPPTRFEVERLGDLPPSAGV